MKASTYDVWFAIGGWDRRTEEPSAGAVRLNFKPLPLARAEALAAKRERAARREYGRGETVLLHSRTGKRHGRAICRRVQAR